MVRKYEQYPIFIRLKRKQPVPKARLVHGVLRDGHDRVIIPDDCPEVTVPLIKLFHSAPGLGHRGGNAVHNIMAPSYVWKNMRAEINNVVVMCLTCQQVKQHHIPRLGVAGVMPIPYQPREIIHLDHITKMPLDNEGHDEILAIKDRFSKNRFY
jgi:hypothetical protein